MQTQTTNSDPCMDVSGHQRAVLEMKEVLALRLPSFYRCALRLLGNAADAEDAVQEALFGRVPTYRPIQGAIADDYLADHDCPQLRAYAIAQTAPPDSLTFG
jgi:hypothetical protein